MAFLSFLGTPQKSGFLAEFRWDIHRNLFFWKSPAGYLPSLWLDFRKLKSPQISGVRYTGRNHKRTRISEFQILISMGISPGLFSYFIVQLSLTSLLSGHVAICHFPDFCREIIWNHNLDIRTMRSFVISPCIPNTRYLPRFQLFCGVISLSW